MAHGTQRSKRQFERAEAVIVSGNNQGGGRAGAHPIYVERGDGCYVWDLDGTRYIDFINSSFILPFGHRYPPVERAIAEQLEKGWVFTAPTESETELARLLCERVPSIEKVKFCVSGTETTMFAVRAARAYTGRRKVAKMAGGFHGTSDVLATSLGIMSAGLPHRSGHDASAQLVLGVPETIAEDVVLLSFNDRKFCEEQIEAHRNDLAAVIVEPVMGAAGMIPPRDGFLDFLREITGRYGILLVFDEMISLGIARGGAQEHYGVIPDLTACGKIIGGGLPIGCLGGRGDVMEVFDGGKGRPWVNHGGTFAGHPLAMVAGAAQLRALTPDVYEGLHRRGDRLRSKLRALCSSLGAPVQITGVGQLFCYHATDRDVTGYESAARSDLSTEMRINAILTREGIHQSQTSRGAVSVAMGDEHLDAYVAAMETTLHELATGEGRRG